MLTPEREKEIRNWFGDTSDPYYKTVTELFAEIDRLRAENKKLLEWGLHEGNRVGNAAADRHTELVIENNQLREKLVLALEVLEQLRDDVSIDSRGCDCPELAREALSKIRGEK